MSQKSVLNVTYKSDLNYSINGARILSIIIGLWPIDFEKSPIKTTTKLFINIASSVIMTFVIVSNILCAIFQLESLQAKVQIAGPTTFYIMSLLKYFLLLHHSESLNKCLSVLEEDWKLIDTQEKRELMLKNAQFGKYISIFSAIFMFSGGLGHHLFKPLLSENIVTEMNISVKPFPTLIYGKYLNSGYSPVHEIVFSSGVTAAFFFLSTTVVSLNLPAVLILHACGQFEIVILYLHDLVSGLKQQKTTTQKRFIVIVNSHLRVLSFVSQLEKLFSGLLLVELICSTINLCLLGYYVIENWKYGNIAVSLNFLVLLMGFIYTMFVYCYLGEKLTMKALNVGQTGYMIDWYQLPKNLSKDLIFFIRICQIPSKLSAGKIAYLSMATFSAMMKTTMAYFNVLWKMD